MPSRKRTVSVRMASGTVFNVPTFVKRRPPDWIFKLYNNVFATAAERMGLRYVSLNSFRYVRQR